MRLENGRLALFLFQSLHPILQHDCTLGHAPTSEEMAQEWTTLPADGKVRQHLEAVSLTVSGLAHQEQVEVLSAQRQRMASEIGDAVRRIQTALSDQQ